MDNFKFIIKKKDKISLARAGVFQTPHGDIKTPAFVTVGTKGTVKSLTPEMVKDLGAQVVLGNTYHLYLEPGPKLVHDLGGLGKFMNWVGPTMTDSGGFQVFSLGAAFGKGVTKVAIEEILEEENNQARLCYIDDDGVDFRSYKDGSLHRFTPEKSMEIQWDIGADIIFAFDECTSPQASETYQREALDRTHRWAERSLKRHVELRLDLPTQNQALFGVVQGGRFTSLRKESARILSSMKVNNIFFDGFGIGGSFTKDDIKEIVCVVNKELPEEKPRHLLGIGEPEDLFDGVEAGCDMFDCVAPTRIARNGSLYTKNGKINILNAKYTNDLSPIDENCDCYTCQNYAIAYIAHLFRSREMLAATLASIHNLHFIITLVNSIRESILNDTFDIFKKEFLNTYETKK